MTLGTITVQAQEKKSASAPLDLIQVQFAGDGSYPSGGTANFSALMAAVLGRAVSVAFVVEAGPCLDGASKQLQPVYDGTWSGTPLAKHDKLMVFTFGGVEASGDLSASTFNLLVACY